MERHVALQQGVHGDVHRRDSHAADRSHSERDRHRPCQAGEQVADAADREAGQQQRQHAPSVWSGEKHVSEEHPDADRGQQKSGSGVSAAEGVRRQEHEGDVVNAPDAKDGEKHCGQERPEGFPAASPDPYRGVGALEMLIRHHDGDGGPGCGLKDLSGDRTQGDQAQQQRQRRQPQRDHRDQRAWAASQPSMIRLRANRSLTVPVSGTSRAGAKSPTSRSRATARAAPVASAT